MAGRLPASALGLVLILHMRGLTGSFAAGGAVAGAYALANGVPGRCSGGSSTAAARARVLVPAALVYAAAIVAIALLPHGVAVAPASRSRRSPARRSRRSGRACARCGRRCSATTPAACTLLLARGRGARGDLHRRAGRDRGRARRVEHGGGHARVRGAAARRRARVLRARRLARWRPAPPAAPAGSPARCARRGVRTLMLVFACSARRSARSRSPSPSPRRRPATPARPACCSASGASARCSAASSPARAGAARDPGGG